MAQKTKITAGEGKQDLVITRVFDLPLALLFKAHTKSEIVTQTREIILGFRRTGKVALRP